jgi:hypothetical protein
MVPGYVYRGGDVPFAPDLLRAKKDQPRVVSNGCHRRLAGEDGAGVDGAAEFASAIASPACSFGDPESDFTVALVGGSHALHWFPAMERIAESRGWHLLSLTKSGCRFTAEPQDDDDKGRSCEAWNAALIAGLVELKPDLVVTNSTISYVNGEYVPEGLLEHFRALEQAGIEVVGIRDTPRWESNPLDCLGISIDAPDQCFVERSRSLADVDPTTLLDDPPSNLTFLDLNDYVCTGDRCPAVIGNVVVYYDSGHLLASYVRTLAPFLDERLPVPADAP